MIFGIVVTLCITSNLCIGQATGKAGKIRMSIDSVLTIRAGNIKLLTYQFNTVYPPAGQDTNYKRSGFIHPLCAPPGQVLIRIQPIGHYHHYGIWNPRTHTVFKKDTIDFWNIKGRTNIVRFAGFTSQTSRPRFAEYTALQEHVVFKKDSSEKIALNEWQTVRLTGPMKTTRLISLTLLQHCVVLRKARC